jgi:hypothetical protein
LNVSRVELFQQAGWLNSSNDEKITSRFREPMASNKSFFRLTIKLLSSYLVPSAQHTPKQLLETVVTILESKKECEKVNYGQPFFGNTSTRVSE